MQCRPLYMQNLSFRFGAGLPARLRLAGASRADGGENEVLRKRVAAFAIGTWRRSVPLASRLPPHCKAHMPRHCTGIIWVLFFRSRCWRAQAFTALRSKRWRKKHKKNGAGGARDADSTPYPTCPASAVAAVPVANLIKTRKVLSSKACSLLQWAAV